MRKFFGGIFLLAISAFVITGLMFGFDTVCNTIAGWFSFLGEKSA